MPTASIIKDDWVDVEIADTDLDGHPDRALYDIPGDPKLIRAPLDDASKFMWYSALAMISGKQDAVDNIAVEKALAFLNCLLFAEKPNSVRHLRRTPSAGCTRRAISAPRSRSFWLWSGRSGTRSYPARALKPRRRTGSS